MHSTERPAFESELAVLFGGFPQFLTAPRIEAYWRGLSKMSMSTFSRCVDYTLSEGGADKLPTVNAIWQISRNLRSQPDARPSVLTAPQLGPVHAYGNRALMNWLRRNGAVSEAALRKILAEKKRLCDAYDLICRDEPEAGDEVRDKLFEAWDALREGVTPEQLASGYERFERMGHL
jgi:hypothetical protein